MKVKCPHCETIQNAPDDADGKKAKCKGCRFVFVLTPYAPEVQREIEEETTLFRPKKQVPLPGLIVADIWHGLGCAALVVAALIAVILLAAGSDEVGTWMIPVSITLWSLMPFSIAAIIKAINANTQAVQKASHANTQAIQELYTKNGD